MAAKKKSTAKKKSAAKKGASAKKKAGRMHSPGIGGFGVQIRTCDDLDRLCHWYTKILVPTIAQSVRLRCYLRSHGIPRQRMAISSQFSSECAGGQHVRHEHIQGVIRALMPGLLPTWIHEKFGTSSSFVSFSANVLSDRPAVLMTADCIHGPQRLRAQHAFLLVGINGRGLEDPAPPG